MDPNHYTQLARTITESAIRQGALVEGHAAEAIGTTYADAARLLYTVDTEIGSEAMVTAARLTIAALDAGLLYPSELAEALTDIARTARNVERELDTRPRGIS